MNLVDTVAKLAPRACDNYTKAFAGGAPLFTKFGVTTPLRIAHFLAQALHETGGFTILEENLNYRADRIVVIFGPGKHSAAIDVAESQTLAGNPRALAERVYGVGNPRKSKELGNTASGDGYNYRGRGILQTTGKFNYSKLGARAGLDLVANPELVVDPNHALLPALLEWRDGNLNAAADRNDISLITRRINGGYNGFADRQQWFTQAWDCVKSGVEVNGNLPAAADEPWRAAAASVGIRQLQSNLRELGVAPNLVVDGLMGPNTRAALIEFQRFAQIPADGIYGPITQAALELRLGVLR